MQHISFLLKAEQHCPVWIWICHILLICSSVDGLSDFVHHMALVNNGAMNISIQVSACLPAFRSFGVYIQEWNC